MAYIYQIINDINGKIYVGKTEDSIEKRWLRHQQDSKRPHCKNRPLYQAMNKYGIENFHIELIEETDSPNEREIYWIENLRSYKNGYNATLGGDGARLIDYDLVIATYKETQSMVETAKIIGCHEDRVSIILKNANIQTLSTEQVNINKNGKIVLQYDLKDNFIQSFPSLRAAAKALNKAGVSHISDACKGKRKTAYGYIWKFTN